MTDTQSEQALARARNNELHASHEAASIHKMEVIGPPDDNGNVIVNCVCGVLLSVNIGAPKIVTDRNLLARRSVNDEKDKP